MGNYLLTTTKCVPELQPPSALTCHHEMFKDKRNFVFTGVSRGKNHSEELLLAFRVFFFLSFFSFAAFLNKATSFEQSSLGCRNISEGMLGQRA